VNAGIKRGFDMRREIKIRISNAEPDALLP
jgi:hypothetical protein